MAHKPLKRRPADSPARKARARRESCGERRPCGLPYCVFDSLPDRLVLEGYRYWMAGYETHSIEPWELGWSLFAKTLGPRNARDVFGAVTAWARECYRHAHEPPRTFPFNCRRLCRHECVALAMISAFQHDDERTGEFCLAQIAVSQGLGQTRRAARDLAETLTAQGHAMIPVPYPVIADIALTPPAPPQGRRLH